MHILHDNKLVLSGTKTPSDTPPAPEPKQARAALHLLLSGAGSGLLMHWLVWDKTGGGLGMLIWTAVSCMAVCWLNRHQSATWRRELLCWTSLMCAAATLTVLRDALAVTALMYLVMLFCLGLVFFRSRGYTLADATIPSVVLTALRLPARVLLSIFPALDTVVRSKWHAGGQLGDVLRGVLLAAPLLFIFVLLFSSADAVFSQYLNRVGAFMGELTPSTPFVSLFMIVLATGLLSCSLVQTTDRAPALNNAQGLWPAMTLQLGRTETAIVLGSLALLFVTFVLLQASYLFGGRELIEMRSGLTLAQYARRGFFELLTVAGLTLAVLMAVASTQCHQLLFRRLGAVLIVCVMIILMSALFRLYLYIEQYGLTLARLVALTVMLWVAASLLWFAVTVLRGNARGFLAGMLVTGMSCFVLLAAINPVARVAEVNVRHGQIYGNPPVDIHYLTELGSDAVPVVVPTLDCSATRFYFGHLAGMRGDPLIQRTPHPVQQGDWRDWNASRAAARQIVTDRLARC